MPLRAAYSKRAAWAAATAAVVAAVVGASLSGVPGGALAASPTPTKPKTAPFLSQAKVSKIRAALVKDLKLGNGYGLSCVSCSLGSTMGALVRLPFHDAVGGGGITGEGGMNGCVDFTDTNSNGLQSIIASLNKVNRKFSKRISRADLWVLAANTAIAFATTPAKDQAAVPNLVPSPGTLNLPFRYGRQDQNTCTGFDAGLIPQASFTWAQMTQTFTGRMGLTAEDIVALMGAHSLGSATVAASGFNGGWTSTQSTFSNLCVVCVLRYCATD